MNAIEVKNIQLSFAQKDVLQNIDWSVKAGKIATLLGPNGCGKSTLLKTIVGNLKPQNGDIFIEGKKLDSYSAKELAQSLAFLPQTPEVPKDMLVEELVYCGRFPHQAWWKNTAGDDRAAVEAAMAETKTLHLREQYVSSLSGGERQRVWIAMALAQAPKILILDEPTTYLDINHQFEVMELLKKLNEDKGLTIVMVLHEINQAVRYSHEVAVLHKGKLVETGEPETVMTTDLLKEVFSVSATILPEDDGTKYIKINGLL